MKYKREIYEAMKELGVCPQNLGYTYACHIINEFLEGNYDMSRVTFAYRGAAKKFNTTHTRVERAIRHSVELVFNKDNNEILNKYFGNCININSGKVCNHTFLVCIVEYLKVYVLKDYS